MVTIEATARTKWCPFARTYRFAEAETQDTQSGYVTVNRDFNGQVDRGARCIGSDCMAWEWSEHLPPRADTPLGRCGLVSSPGRWVPVTRSSVT